MSFYRIYRPQVIEDMDNGIVRDKLLTLLRKNVDQLPHAYLLTGPKGSGKTTAARLIAKVFNCVKRTKNGPCGTCEQCESIAGGNNIDVMEIDAASNRGIDDIRQLREGVRLAPSSGKFKVFIIDEVHMLTTEAFNALLKTLEEPPLHAIFVLATTDPQKIPATIKSRCTSLSFGKASKDELLHALKRVVKSEKMDIEKEALEAIADVADGAFRDAIKLLEQASFLDKPITKESVMSLLSESDETRRKALVHAIIEKDTKTALGNIKDFVADGIDMKLLLTDILKDLHGHLVEKGSGIGCNECQSWSMGTITVLIASLSEAYVSMRTSPISELPLELAVVGYCMDTTDGKKKEETTKERKDDGIKGEEKREEKKEFKGEEKKEVHDELDDGVNGLLTLEKLEAHWTDFIESLKPFNHSIAGVMRSAKPKKVEKGIVTIEAFYPFHQERLSETKVRDMLSSVLKKLFGATVKVEIVLGKK